MEKEPPYKMYPQKVRDKILSAWKDYRELFGFSINVERKLRKELEESSFSKELIDEEVDKELDKRKEDIDKVWRV
jgi:hypothetical protein